MRKRFVCLIVSVLIYFIDAFAQIGYYYGDKYIQLFPDTTKGFFVLSRSDHSRQSLMKRVEKDGNNKKGRVVSLSKNGFLVSTLDMKESDDFVSKIFHFKSGEQVIVLPRILVSLTSGASIDEIIAKMNNDKVVFSVENNPHLTGVTCISCNLTTSEDVLRAVAQLKTYDGVDWCEPDMLCEWESCNTNPLFPLQSYLESGNSNYYDINVVPAWEVIEGYPDITVAVIDQGVDSAHEDLVGNVLQGYTANNPTGYGEPQNVNDNDSKSHGTACAGIIGAKDNNIGIKGVASGVKILPVNIVPNYSPGGFAENSEIASAIEWAANRSDILSCSWSSQGEINVIAAKIKEALTEGRKGKGCVIVAAAGNRGDEEKDVAFPARIEGVISVGAIKRNGEIWNYSQRGKNLDLVAPSGGSLEDFVTLDRPGELGRNTSKTVTDLPDKNYTKKFSGTSAACPQVAGVVALMLSRNPALSGNQVRTILQKTAKDLGPKGKDDTFGYGLVDAYAAVNYVPKHEIKGAHVIAKSSSYTLDYLQDGATVEWSLSDSYYNQNCLQQNVPSQNQCTITRCDSIDMQNATLTAIVKYHGNVIRTLKMYNLNAFKGFKGYYNSGNFSGEIKYPYLIKVSPMCGTYINSPNIIGASVRYDPKAGKPYIWGYSTDSGEIIAGMSEDRIPILIDITDDAGNYYMLTLLPANQYYLNVSSKDNNINITLQGEEKAIDKECENTNWTYNIHNVTSGNLMIMQKTDKRSVTVPTSGWPKGVYLVKAKVDKEEYSEKILVK